MAKASSAGDITFVVETTETQRFFPLLGWGKKRLPTDRPEWADRTGKLFQSKELMDRIMPRECEWTSDWSPTVDGETDSEGWQYALDFPQSFSAKKGALHFVRRRFWRRAGRVKPAFAEHGVVNCPALEAVILADGVSHEGSCNACGMHFSRLAVEKRCAICKHDFCARCGKLFSGAWKCATCISQEVEAHMTAHSANISSAVSLEQQVREGYVEEERRDREWMFTQEADERAAAAERAKVRGTKPQGEKERVLEKWSKCKEPRQGLLHLTILSATGVPVGSAQRRLRATVRFPGTAAVHGTPSIPNGVNPAFNSSAEALISQDTDAVIIQIEEFAPKLIGTGVSDRSTPLMKASLVLHDKHEGVVHSVTDSLIYLEKGCAVLPAFDWQTSKPLVGGASITVKWVFEVREPEGHAFCDTCGSLKDRCSCK